MYLIELNMRNMFIGLCRYLSCEIGYTQYAHPKKRRQLFFFLGSLSHPLETKQIEGIPSKNIPPIFTQEQGEQYFLELMSPDKGNYTYTYGERINKKVGLKSQLEIIIDKLKTGYTNNAQIHIAEAGDYIDCYTDKLDKPCLQLIDFKIIPDQPHINRLDIHIIFRSWDVFAFPYNVYGLARLSEYVAEHADLKLGNLFCYSSGLNVREEMFELCNNIAKYLQKL
jgi:thymidylate synthase